MPWPQRFPPTASRLGGLAAVLLLCGVFYLATPGSPFDPAIAIRFEKRPELRNIQQLRGVRLEQLTPCQLPEIAVPSSGTVAISTDGTFKMHLSREWVRTHIDTTSTNFRPPEVTYRNPAVGSISIMRITNGAAGRSFSADSTGEPWPVALMCEVSNDSAGSIWTFYNNGGKGGYSALADAITPQGKRHKFSVYSPSQAQRDSLASLIAFAVLHQQL